MNADKVGSGDGLPFCKVGEYPNKGQNKPAPIPGFHPGSDYDLNYGSAAPHNPIPLWIRNIVVLLECFESFRFWCFNRDVSKVEFPAFPHTGEDAIGFISYRLAGIDRTNPELRIIKMENDPDCIRWGRVYKSSNVFVTFRYNHKKCSEETLRKLKYKKGLKP